MEEKLRLPFKHARRYMILKGTNIGLAILILPVVIVYAVFQLLRLQSGMHTANPALAILLSFGFLIVIAKVVSDRLMRRAKKRIVTAERRGYLSRWVKDTYGLELDQAQLETLAEPAWARKNVILSSQIKYWSTSATGQQRSQSLRFIQRPDGSLMLFDDETETEYQSLAGKQRQERWNRFWRAAERNDDIVYLLQDPEDDGILAIKSEDFGIIPIWSDATLARLYTTDESYQVQGFTLDELRESILPQLIEDDLACALDVEGEVAEEDLFDPAMVRRAIV